MLPVLLAKRRFEQLASAGVREFVHEHHFVGARLQVLGQILHHESDQLPQMRLFTDPEPTPVSNRLKNVPPASPWNAHEWEVTQG